MFENTGKLAAFDELPTIPLYLDQLLLVLNTSMGGYADGEAAVTKTMINNYVKQKLLEAPKKKKYTREHVAALIIITFLKRVFSLTDIKLMLDTAAAAEGMEATYTAFCAKLDSMADAAKHPDGYAAALKSDVAQAADFELELICFLSNRLARQRIQANGGATVVEKRAKPAKKSD